MSSKVQFFYTFLSQIISSSENLMAYNFMLFILGLCYPVEIHLTRRWDNPAVIKAVPVNNS